jgi:sodium-dependent dicarboxylate transporter 2/3/5
MTFPISTPPNAMAYATGMCPNAAMAKTGFITGIVGLMMLVGMMLLLTTLGFFKGIEAAVGQ